MVYSYKISDEFLELEEFVWSVPGSFDRIGLTIQGNRNVIKKVDTPKGTFIIKNFKGMYFFNRLAYSLFRRSKAERSYCYSALLREKGILTPPPIAWIDCYQWGLLSRSYFISLYYPYKTLSEIARHPDIKDADSRIFLYNRLAKFAIRLHRHGIYHDDFSSGNILVIVEPHGYTFALVDLNRIKFQKVSHRKGLQNFVKLGIPQSDLDILIREYARLSGESEERSIETFWMIKKRSGFLRKIIKVIRRYTLTPLENL